MNTTNEEQSAVDLDHTRLSSGNGSIILILEEILEDIPYHGPRLAEDLHRSGGDIKRQAVL